MGPRFGRTFTAAAVLGRSAPLVDPGALSQGVTMGLKALAQAFDRGLAALGRLGLALLAAGLVDLPQLLVVTLGAPTARVLETIAQVFAELFARLAARLAPKPVGLRAAAKLGPTLPSVVRRRDTVGATCPEASPPAGLTPGRAASDEVASDDVAFDRTAPEPVASADPTIILAGSRGTATACTAADFTAADFTATACIAIESAA
ncbi:hypothetical protein [Engelhardtia mirabilis]|uniref:Uncharacterized protein n=1 Tax=Engelhardtia mirabilis TaxID=2528011 RepID=A0A518BHY9_9BACT|nr:hypothetical protein Pla133_16760 [Planctomycetes bacterium Pla133]QDV00926.1 hypothetical protein Pla86_16750 [Planctomycetes bacterium Pla86]